MIVAGMAAGLPARAGDVEAALRPASTADAAPPFVELVAEDFFENRLRLSQSRRIEAETARHYLSLAPLERERFRADRRARWRAMSEEQRAALRGVKTPQFSNLDEEQKLVFRRIASDELGATAYTAEAGEDDI